MPRREPPPIAVWMLGHMTTGDHDEALAGDLLEVFQNGQSNSWYWRQALAACGVSWIESLRARASFLVYALLWSMAAPAWNSLCIRVEEHQIVGRIYSVSSQIRGPFAALVALIGWTLIHGIFLWSSLLIFGVIQKSIRGSLYPNKFKRAFLLAPLIFVPAYGAMFLLVSLYWFGSFAHSQLPSSTLGQVVDLRALADVIRLPYLLALVAAMWTAIPRSSRTSRSDLHDPLMTDSAEQFEVVKLTSAAESFAAKRFFTLMVVAGLMNAMIAGFLLCRLPEAHDATFAALCIRAAIYVLAGVLAGAIGTYIYWKNPASPFSTREPLPFPLFALICAGGWVWIPAMVILSEQLSPVTAIVAMIGAFVLTSELRRMSPFDFAPKPCLINVSGQSNADLFVDLLYPSPIEPYGYLSAISLYSGSAALCLRWYHTAAVLLALAVAVIAWNRTIPQNTTFDKSREYRGAAMRLARWVVPALLITVWALLDGVTRRNRIAEASTGAETSTEATAEVSGLQQSNNAGRVVSGGGYESLILWPYPKKEQVVPPIVMNDTLLAPGTRKPVIIHFTGTYWYLQPPNKRPGTTAHHANGTPFNVDIRSINSLQLVMDAHQFLSAPIRTDRCREITVEIENRDNRAGVVSLGVLLADGISAKKPTVYLGQQQILSTQPGHFFIKTEPLLETLHFTFPANATAKKFDEITVLFLPDIEHAFEAPKIAVKQFRLFPR
jgi:hypothetical protein